jgi:hypothetical protein
MARFDIAECRLDEGSLETTICIVTDKTLFYFVKDPNDGIPCELRLRDTSSIHPNQVNVVDPKVFSPKLREILRIHADSSYYKEDRLGYILVRAEESCDNRPSQKAN